MYNQKRGNVWTEMIIIVLAIAIVLILMSMNWKLFFVRQYNQDPPCRQSKCKANLTQFRTALTQYQLDLGRQVFFPQKQGQGFLTTLYEEEILVESLVYLCPNATDTNNNGLDLIDAPELGDETGPVSYAGRINSKQNVYPGLFKISDETATTPMVSDDFVSANQSKVNGNHERGTLRNLLFLDGHVDHIREKNHNFDVGLFSVLRN